VNLNEIRENVALAAPYANHVYLVLDR